MALWEKRGKYLIHDYAVARWAFSVQSEICSHCINLLTGSQHLQIEQDVVKLHQKPCPNLNKINEYISFVDIFWTEFKNFQTNRFPFANPGQFSMKDALAGRSHIWHEMYSLPYTHVLGFVACRVTSKCLGIGAGERSWSDMKMIKDGKRSNLSGDSLEKEAILYTSACLEEARICSEHKCSNNIGNKFTDEDME